MKKEYDFQKMRVAHRGAVIPPNAKITLPVCLDADVLSWLVRRAAQKGTDEDTVLNATVRKVMRASAPKKKANTNVLPEATRERLRRAG